MAKRAARGEEDEGISKLPEEIIQHILGNFLTPKEAAQSRLLSKAWLSAWQTCPFLSFEQPFLHIDNCDLKEQQHKDMFRIFVEKVLQNYREKNNGIHTLKLRMSIQHGTPDYRSLSEWLKIATGCGLKKLHLDTFWSYSLCSTILETESLEELFLDTNISFRRPWSHGKCSNLRRLVLEHAFVSDETLEKIITSCRLIENLSILQCGKLKNIQIRNLAKLKEFSVRYDQAQNVEIDAPTLEAFTCLGFAFFCGDMPRMPKFIATQNLKHLLLRRIGITEDFFDDFSIKLPHIEDLRIETCDRLNTIKFSSQSLKIMQLKSNRELKELQVQAPKIVRFEYDGYIIPHVVFTNSSTNWESRICLFISDGIDNSWFAKLKEMLKNLIFSKIYLELWDLNSVNFYLDKTRDVVLQPGPDVEMFLLEFTTAKQVPGASSAFLDGCFWSCHPKSLQIWWGCEPTMELAKFIYQMMLERRNHSPEANFWGKDVKHVEVVILKRIGTEWHPELLDWKALLETDPYRDVERAVRFNFEW